MGTGPLRAGGGGWGDREEGGRGETETERAPSWTGEHVHTGNGTGLLRLEACLQ